MRKSLALLFIGIALLGGCSSLEDAEKLTNKAGEVAKQADTLGDKVKKAIKSLQRAGFVVTYRHSRLR
ncbi:hypothetical protein GLW08_20570 [Pontibacillus yanchengensis]|uniref:Uncharacterized protein n=2 Tax=Pontibacillus yanchengensis TaxID=462910 RepID=A0ACC7VLT0_9BACI|nr:hypothetical protein [Pontibacillus yanchengensis]MYL35500.1 hypothetical protein [Pontibacillus yanchengensis]MYL55700.1 hypothetical protein [Pontibacillus yanchengensis]